MKKTTFVMIFLLMGSLSLSGCAKVDQDINNYLKSGYEIDSLAKDVMPDLNSLPKYENIHYQFYDQYMEPFGSMTMVLVLEYDKETYESKANMLEGKYYFLDKTIVSEDDPNMYLVPEYDFAIESYHFRIVNGIEGDNTVFPKSFGLIATSDEKHSIAYLYFYNSNQDYISDAKHPQSMAGFIKRNFKYPW